MPTLTIQELDKELRNKVLRPIYYIYGPENYLARTATALIKEHVKKLAGEGFAPDRFSAKSATPSEIVACAETVPMWVQHRLIIVDDADAFKETGELGAYFGRPVASATLVFLAQKSDGRTKFAQLCSTKAAVIECKSLYENKIPDWLRMEAKEMGKTISIDAADTMTELVGTSLGELHSSLEKVILYIGAKKTIDVDDVETVLTETSRKNIFAFTDAVGSKKISDAVHCLDRLLAFNESEIMMLSMLARHWRILIKTKEAMLRGTVDRFSLMSLLGVKQFLVDKYLQQAKLFTTKELKDGFKKLYGTDKLLKSSKLSKKTLLKKCVQDMIFI